MQRRSAPPAAPSLPRLPYARVHACVLVRACVVSIQHHVRLISCIEGACRGAGAVGT